MKGTMEQLDLDTHTKEGESKREQREEREEGEREGEKYQFKMKHRP